MNNPGTDDSGANIDFGEEVDLTQDVGPSVCESI